MDELIKTFHIELNLLVAQIVNFTIVLVVLYKFAYKPVLKTLNDRTKKIDKGIKDSELAAKKLSEITEKEKEVLTKAKKEAQEIMKKAEIEAKGNANSLMLEARNGSDKILEDAKRQIEQEKEKIIAEAKTEVANLVILATEKIIGEKMDKEKDKELIEKSLNH
jgi:F-type H+-transporting ATPase subunit b